MFVDFWTVAASYRSCRRATCSSWSACCARCITSRNTRKETRWQPPTCPCASRPACCGTKRKMTPRCQHLQSPFWLITVSSSLERTSFTFLVRLRNQDRPILELTQRVCTASSACMMVQVSDFYKISLCVWLRACPFACVCLVVCFCAPVPNVVPGVITLGKKLVSWTVFSMPVRHSWTPSLFVEIRLYLFCNNEYIIVFNLVFYYCI